MKHLSRLLMVVTAFAIFSPSAFAMVEIRGLVGLEQSSPSDVNDTLKASNGGNEVKFDSLTSFGADFLIEPMMFPIGFGVRYQTASQKVSSNGTDFTLSHDRIALVVNKRFINTGLFLGPIATYGVSNNLKLKTETAGVSTEYTGDAVTSYSVGLEGGFKMGGLRLGAEVGYQSFSSSKLKDSAGNALASSQGGDMKADLSGIYALAIIGLGF